MSSRKVQPLIVAIAMLLSLMMPLVAFAADPVNDLWINAPSDRIQFDKDDFTAYMLFSLVKSEPDPVTLRPGYAYTPVDGVDGFADHFLSLAAVLGPPTAPATEYDAWDLKSWLEDDPSGPEMELFNKELKKWYASPGFGSEMGPYLADDDTAGSKIVFEDLKYGYYFVVGEVAAENGETIIVFSNLITVEDRPDDAAVVVDAKADAPDVVKFVSDKDETAFKYDQKETDVNIGDKVWFEILTYVPAIMDGYDKYQFDVIDVLGEGFTFDPDADPGSYKVSILIPGTPDDTIVEIDLDEIDLDVAVDADNIVTFIFNNFKEDFDLYKGYRLSIVYETVLNEDAEIAKDANVNSVTVVYSSNPYDLTETAETTPDNVKVYTYELAIKKLDKDVQTDELEGVVFWLTRVGTPDVVLEFIYDSVLEAYRLPITDVEKAAAKEDLVSNATGDIRIVGLDHDLYVLQEVEALPGYNKLYAEIEIDIARDTAGAGEYSVTYELLDARDDANVSMYGTGAAGALELGSLHTLRLLNKAGGLFPGTGGIGTTIFYTAAFTLLAVAMGAYLASRRRSTPSILDA